MQSQIEVNMNIDLNRNFVFMLSLDLNEKYNARSDHGDKVGNCPTNSFGLKYTHTHTHTVPVTYCTTNRSIRRLSHGTKQ